MPLAFARKKSRSPSRFDRKPTVPLEKLLNSVAAGMADADIVSTLAARLARLERDIDAEQEAEIKQAAGGTDLATLRRDLLASIDADAVAAQTVLKFQLPVGQEPAEKLLDEVEYERMRRALKPFLDPRLRGAVLKAKQSLEQVIDEQTRDTLLRARLRRRFKERAQTLITSFRQFIDDHKDEIEALQVLLRPPAVSRRSAIFTG